MDTIKEFFLGFVLPVTAVITTLLFFMFLFLLIPMHIVNKNSCEFYGKRTNQIVDYSAVNGCMVKENNSWKRSENTQTIEIK